MDIWDVLWTIYVIVAGTAMILTYREQIKTGHRILVYRARVRHDPRHPSTLRA